jgi:hypothetical protein
MMRLFGLPLSNNANGHQYPDLSLSCVAMKLPDDPPFGGQPAGLPLFFDYSSHYLII